MGNLDAETKGANSFYALQPYDRLHFCWLCANIIAVFTAAVSYDTQMLICHLTRHAD